MEQRVRVVPDPRPQDELLPPQLRYEERSQKGNRPIDAFDQMCVAGEQ